MLLTLGLHCLPSQSDSAGAQKKQKAEASAGKGANEAPFTINTLRDTDGKALVEDTAPPRPCILEALGSAASGGFIGALYGFGMYRRLQASSTGESMILMLSRECRCMSI